MKAVVVVWLLVTASCVDARMVALHRGPSGKQRSCMPGGSARDVGALVGHPRWKELLGPLTDAANQCEVVEFASTIEPIGPGFITYGGFASDMAQKRRDQLLGEPESGEPLAAVCAGPVDASPAPSVALPALGDPPDVEDFYLVNHLEPAYRNVWFPVARIPDAPRGAGAFTCDALGRPGEGGLCVFARVARQADPTAPVVMIAHGLFDSSSHRYVRNAGASLYAMGFAVVLLDLRDHGNTLRANGPDETGTTLGPREGHDVVAIARQLRDPETGCGARGVGFVGFSGGGAAGVHAYAVDEGDAIDLGVAAVSPLVDPAGTIDRMQRAPSACGLTRATEIPLAVDIAVPVAMSVVAGALTTGYTSLEAGEPTWPERGDAAAIAIGAGLVAGLITWTLDAVYDDSPVPALGGRGGCFSSAPIANLFRELVAERGAALGAPFHLDHPTLRTYPLQRSKVTLATLREQAAQLPARVFAAAAHKRARLAIVSAHDDPVVGWSAIARFTTRPDLDRVAVFPLTHGGHTSFASLSPVYARQFLHHFFCSGPVTCTPPGSSATQDVIDRE